MSNSGRISWLILLLALGLLFHRLLLGDTLFWGLPSLQFIPWRTEAISLMQEGQFPFWTSLNGAGAPLFANYQSALLYPLTLPTYILPVAQSMSFLAVLHLLIAGIGMWQFTRQLGMSPLGRGISLLAFGLSGYLVARIGTFPIIQAAAWLPWLLWGAVRLLEQVSPRRMAWMTVFVALVLLAGHAQTAWYSLLLTGIFTLVYGLTHNPRYLIKFAAFIGSILLGMGIAAVQLIGTTELLTQSQRSGGVDYDFAMNLSYAPARTLNLLSPHVFGTPADGSYITGGAYFEDAVYIGFIPLISAVTAIVGWGITRRKKNNRSPELRSVPFWLGITIVGFVLALGINTPIFPFLFDNIPTFDTFQAPVRWHLWTVFGLSVLAGIGASHWERGRHIRRWLMRLLVGAVGAVVLALLLLLFAPSNIQAVNLLARAVIYTGLVGIAAVFLTLTQPPGVSPVYRRWMLLTLLIIAGDLVFANWGLNPTVTADFYTVRTQTSPQRLFWQQEALESTRFEEFLRFDDYRVAVSLQDSYRNSLLPNINMLDEMPLLNNFDPLLPGHHLDYIDLVEMGQTNSLLQAAGVGRVIGGERNQYQLSLDSSRVWLVRSACWHLTEQALRDALLDPAWNPHEQAHFLGDAGCEDVLPLAGTAQIIQDRGNEVVIKVNTERDAWLVLADTDYPGWSALVNGEDTPIFRANLAFRAVQVQSGESEVRFAYQPTWALSGALVSIVSLVGLLLLFRLRSSEGSR